MSELQLISEKTHRNIDELEALMLDMVQVDCPLTHDFVEGMYIRKIFMPAGSLITSKIHKTQHPYVVTEGVCSVKVNDNEWVLIEAPYHGITQKNTRRVLYIHEDTTWTTYHPTKVKLSNFKTVEDAVNKIEAQIIQKRINFISNNKKD